MEGQDPRLTEEKSKNIFQGYRKAPNRSK